MATESVTVRLESRVGSIRDVLAEHWFAYLLFVPTLLFLVLVLWIPFFQGVYISLFNWPFFGEPEWVGLGNYEWIIGLPEFGTMFWATVVFATTTVFQLVVAIIATQAIYHQKRLRNLIGGITLIPYTMPPVVMGTIWLYLLDPDYGPFFKYLTNTGVLETPIYWATHGDTALLVITLVTAWTFWPFMFLILLASRQSIPESHYDCAKVYGANTLQTFRRITLPQLKSAILVAVALRIVWNLSKVSQPYQMTGGGPGYETSIFAVQLYKYANETGQMGLAFATGMILLLLVVVFVVVFIREFERESARRA